MQTPASTDAYDVIIVGSGFAGSLVGYRLATAGLRVAILEAGPRTDRDAAVRRHRGGVYAYESPEWAPQPTTSDLDWYYVQAGATKFSSDYERRVGGTSWHWLGNAPRLLPSDFQMQSRFGVGMDWPITYDDLEPWYVDAEQELGVAGDSKANDGSPRSAPFPMQPHPLASGDLMFAEAAAGLGLELLATPQARNSVDGYQGRSICCGNATCIPVCPVQAKYDATYHLDLAEQAGAQIIENAVVFAIEIGSDGAVAGVTYRNPDRTDVTVTARTYLVAANGIETPKLLLMSKGEYAPNGVANSSDQVGRNLQDHPEARVSAVSPTPYAGYRGPLQLSGIDATREGDFRGNSSAMRLQVSHSVGNPQNAARQLITQGLVGEQLFAQIGQVSMHQVRLASMLEQLPDPENRVLPDEQQVDAIGIPRPKLIYGIADYTNRGWVAANALHDQMLQAIGATDVLHSEELGGVGHLMGTYRMGSDPATSVTDSFGRTHDHANLFLAGAGLFPTSGTANPTLTLSALALRAATEIASEFGITIEGTTPAEAMATPA